MGDRPEACDEFMKVERRRSSTGRSAACTCVLKWVLCVGHVSVERDEEMTQISPSTSASLQKKKMKVLQRLIVTCL